MAVLDSGAEARASVPMTAAVWRRPVGGVEVSRRGIQRFDITDRPFDRLDDMLQAILDPLRVLHSG